MPWVVKGITMTVGSLFDTLVVTLGIGLLIVRQFLWREADPQKILRFPLAIVGIGVVALGWEIVARAALTPLTFMLLGAEVALVCLTGSAMGMLTELRESTGRLHHRLSRSGVVLWAVFVAIRVGSFLLADRFGAHLLETTGAILVSFGINRLASSLVVRRKIDRYRNSTGADSDALTTRKLPSAAGRADRASE